jgi:hypothetical protein
MLIQRKSKQFGSLLVSAFDQDNEFDRPTMVEAVQILESVETQHPPNSKTKPSYVLRNLIHQDYHYHTYFKKDCGNHCTMFHYNV